MAVIGIDFGTTNSCAAILQGDEPAIIVNAEGERVTPSVVAIGRNGDRLIGNAAKRQAIVNPENTIFSVKRFIGRPFHSGPIQEYVKRFPFKITESPKGDVRFDASGKKFSPEELSAMILTKIKAEAESFLGEEVKQAVITVPAYYDDRQRSATKDAGKIAGLDVLRLINEPTAAALAYGVHRRGDRVIAVYDLGGGTFDISILEQKDGDFRVLATSGDAFLGGDDFDQMLMDWLGQEFEKRNGVELQRDPTILQRLKNAAESAKKDLSFSESTQVTVPFIMGGASGPLHLDVELMRAEFENLVSALVDRTLTPCESALKDAGIKAGDVDAVLLVGGQTRSPIVQRKVEQFFGKAPIKGINPDEAVAMGAAVTAGIRTGEIDKVNLHDVTPLSLGIETAGGVCTKIIARNTPIPASAKKVFTTTEDDQLIIRIHVLQGEREMASDNRTLGIFDLVGVRPAPKGVPSIEITFSIDEEGIVHVQAKDQDTGRTQSLRITGAGGLTDNEIKRIITDAEKYQKEDEKIREWVAQKNKGMNLVYSAERLLDDPSAKLVTAYRKRLGDTVHRLRESLGAKPDPSAVEKRMTDLVDVLKELEYEP